MDKRSFIICLMLIIMVCHSSSYVICPDRSTACPEQCCKTKSDSYNCCELKYDCCDYGRMCCVKSSKDFSNFLENVKYTQSTPSIVLDIE